MDLKSVQLSNLKAGEDDGLEAGQFEAYASTWTLSPDSYGDIVKKGAFKETLAEWAKSSAVLPILYGHDIYDPFNNLGGADAKLGDLIEDEHGLKVRASLDLENPTAMQVYRMLKGRRINQMSFAFDVLESGDVEVPKADGSPDKIRVRELRKMKLHEISVVPFGANSDTEVLAVKANAHALELKAGRTISAKNLESLKTAHAAIGAVISAAGEDSATDEDEANSGKSAAVEAQERKAAADHAKSVLAKAAFIVSL